MTGFSEKFDYILITVAKIVSVTSAAVFAIVILYKFLNPTFFNGLTPHTDNRLIGLNLVIEILWAGGILIGFPCIAISIYRFATQGKRAGKYLLAGIAALLMGVCLLGFVYSLFAPPPLYSLKSFQTSIYRLCSSQ